MSDNTSKGVGLPTILFLVFLVLKLLGKIDWSWWWVTSPLWISGIFGLVLVIALVVVGIKAWQNE